MSRTTFQNALAEIYGLLASDSAGTPRASLSSAGCVRVLPYDGAAGGAARPCSVTVSPLGIEPTDWTIAVRVYVSDQDPARAQDLLVDNTVAVDTLLAGGQGYGPSRWQFGWDETIGWFAASEVQVGREDGF